MKKVKDLEKFEIKDCQQIKKVLNIMKPLQGLCCLSHTNVVSMQYM